jgi:hypothetical protein
MLADVVAITAQQLTCGEPACLPIETVIAVLAASPRCWTISPARHRPRGRAAAQPGWEVVVMRLCARVISEQAGSVLVEAHTEWRPLTSGACLKRLQPCLTKPATNPSQALQPPPRSQHRGNCRALGETPAQPPSLCGLQHLLDHLCEIIAFCGAHSRGSYCAGGNGSGHRLGGKSCTSATVSRWYRASEE